MWKKVHTADFFMDILKKTIGINAQSTQELPECLTGEWTHALWCVHKMIFYIAVRINKTQLHATAWWVSETYFWLKKCKFN